MRRLRGSFRGLRRRGFTRFDLLVLVVSGTIFIAACDSLFGVRSREPSRKSACNNNLKQIALALLSYETQFGSFPYGSRIQTDPKTDQWISDWGPSWWLGASAFAEGGAVTRNFDYNRPQCSLTLDRTGNGAILDGYTPGYMHCPASSLSATVKLTSGLILPAPTYVGISGTVPDVTAIPITPNWKADWLPQVPMWYKPPQGPTPRCTTQSNPEGTLGGNGIFPPNQTIKVADAKDGMSNTIMVGEQSDFGIDAAASNAQVDIRSCGPYGAWLGLGNTGGQNITTIDPTVPGTVSAYNCTTIAFPINSKVIRTAATSSKQSQITVPGIVGISLQSANVPALPSKLGNNNGVQSVHSGGANVALGDGRVTFLLENMDFRVFLYLCCRDDQRAFLLP